MNKGKEYFDLLFCFILNFIKYLKTFPQEFAWIFADSWATVASMISKYISKVRVMSKYTALI